MAKSEIKRITICGLKKDRKAVLEALQRNGAVEVENVDMSELGLEKLDTSSSQATFQKAISSIDTALDILEKFEPEKKSLFASFEGRETISVDKYYSSAKECAECMNVVSQINAQYKEIADTKAEIIRKESQIESLKPWSNLDIPMTYSGTKRVAAFIGTFPEGKSYEDIISEYALTCEKLNYDFDKIAPQIEIVGKESELTYVFVMAYSKHKSETEEILRNMGFARPSVLSNEAPKEKINELLKEIEVLKEMIKLDEIELQKSAKWRDKLKFISDYYKMRVEKYEVLATLNQSKRVFVISGYIPENRADALEEILVSKYSSSVEIRDLTDYDDPPVLLENNSFSAPVETVLETFSMPGRGEIDPTSVMSIFYYILFGLMLSDAAYGFIMAVGCAFVLLKFKNMESSMKKSMQMFMYCGISTVFWGVMFGSYFGDAITVISTTYFNHPITVQPLWFEPIKDPMKMLMFSFGLGIIHLFAGLAMKFYTLWKSKQYKDAIYDVVFWYLLVGGGIVYLFSLDMFVDMAGFTFKLPPLGADIAAVAAGIGAVGIILTGGRSSKNPGKRFLKGLYELYGVTSYLSDILSYSRLLALGLATGVIAQVFNKMGSMFGSGTIGFILFMIVFVIGHSLNIGINALGAYVHTNRLQFVEFFGKFYEGGGRKYNPFSINTKYYKIKEEN